MIYEMLLRDFLDAHDYATLVDTLGYLERLGVNAIELMPVSEFGGNINWGYQPQFYFAPDKYYGPAEDLKRFVDEAHTRGIAVILDVVYNHVDLPSPLALLYGATSDNRWLNIPPRHPYNVFFDLNHEDPYTQYWLDRANEYWLTEFKVDGFRFDLSKGFTQRETRQDASLWGAYDASRIQILTRMADHIWDINPQAYVILEHFGGNREERELAHFGMDRNLPGMMVWNNVSYPIGEATMGFHRDGRSDFSGAYYGAGGRDWTLPHMISYMESHDEQWLMYKNLRFGACEQSPSGGDACDPSLDANMGAYNVRHQPIALDRMKMAGAFFFLLPGPRMMWQFGELGYGYGDRGEECLRPNDCPGFAAQRIGPKPIRWDYRADPLRAKLYATWAALLRLRQEYGVFRSMDTKVTLELDGPVKRIHLAHPDMNVEIVGNFGVAPALSRSRISTPPRYWYDFFSGDSLDVTGSRDPMFIPGEFHIYTTQRLEPPAPDLITVGVQGPPPVPEAIRLEENYPNPFSAHTTIRYEIPQRSFVRLEVFDVLGRRVAVLAEGVFQGGFHEARFDAAHLPSGLYAVRLQSGSRLVTRTMLRIR